MKLTHTPAKIFLFKEFPVSHGEIKFQIDNDTDKNKYLHRYGVLRNKAYLPMGRVDVHGKEALRDDSGHFILPKGEKSTFFLTIERGEIDLAQAGQEYTVCLQAESSPRFCWMDFLTEKLELFKEFARKPETSGEELAFVHEVLQRSLPESLFSIPLHIQNLVRSKDTLCLDFGTSYSVCAAFVPGNLSKDLVQANRLEANTIDFTMFRDHEDRPVRLEPTELLLKSYDPETKQAEWLFGHAARHVAKTNRGKASFVIGLKSVLGDLEKTDNYYDIDGNAADFTYEDILTEYLRHLTETSKKHFGIDFKNIHVSTPVLYTERQRVAYEKVLRKIGFDNIEARLDEAKSPLYYFLSRQVNEYATDGRDGKKTLSYFVVDCGGGSMDATLIRTITIDRTEDGTDAIELKFDNTEVIGNPFFGGQTLTLYLFKYLKFIIKSQLLPPRDLPHETAQYPIEQLLDYTDSDIFYRLYEMEEAIKDKQPDDVAQEQIREVYGRFEDAYRELEELIPTRYRDYQLESDDFYHRVRENFHLLWQLAEAIKVQIYSRDGSRNIRLGDLAEWKTAPGIWCFNEDERKHVMVKELIENIQLSLYELNKLYRPIIFIEISRLFRDLKVDSKKLMDDTLYVRFVGQTTRIPLFDEALGYHLPRKMIEKDTNGRFKATKPEDKKLCTASGAAQYLRHVLSGIVTDKNFAQNEMLLFDIYRFKHDARTLREARPLISRGTRVESAEGSYIRTLAVQSEDYVGYKFQEYRACLGTVEFDKADITREISSEEKERLKERHGENWRELKDTNMLILIKVENIQHAQRLAFYPYIQKGEGRYYSTEQPVELKFQSDNIFFSHNHILSGEI